MFIKNHVVTKKRRAYNLNKLWGHGFAKKIVIATLVIFTLILLGCDGKKTEYPHGDDTLFSGYVFSMSFEPIPYAQIDVNGEITETDKLGFFEIWVPTKEPDVATRFVMNIRKTGYGLLSKVYYSGVEDGLWFLTEATVVLIDPTQDNTITDNSSGNICNGSLSSQVDWENYESRRIPRLVDDQGNYIGEPSNVIVDAVHFAENAEFCNDSVSIFIPANSLEDSEGYEPTGEVYVSLSTIDIYDPDSMPGDYSVDVEGNAGYMITYGAGIVDVYSSTGVEYQLQKMATATLTIPINSAQLKLSKNLAPTIPLLLYDEQTGVWEEVSTAVLNEKQDAYIAEIDHFSAFNTDLVKTDQSCVRIDSSALSVDFDLEIVIPNLGDILLRTFMDNTPETLHVIYNLPSNTEIEIRAFALSVGVTIPLTDTIVVNTGAPQNPSTPNRPDYPYTACNSSVILTEDSLAPILSGPATSTGSFTLSWDYQWTGLVSSNDNYVLEESTASATSGFSVIDTIVTNNSHVDYPITRTTGEYWYRVKAVSFGSGGVSPYSNVVHVSVNTTSGNPPTTLRIINDLYHNTDQYGNPWGQWNGIIRVRIGATCNEVEDPSYPDSLYANETVSAIVDEVVIYPAYAQDTNYVDFDVSGIQLASDGTYCIFIQAGYWDRILDTVTFAYLYSEKRNTDVYACDDITWGEIKWISIPVWAPFGNPEVIRAADFLPHGNWLGHWTCP